MKYLILFCVIYFTKVQCVTFPRNSFDAPINMPLHLWPGAKINYYFDDDYPEKARKTFRSAVNEININTCVKFVEGNNLVKNAVLVKEHSMGCVSTLGRHQLENVIKVNSTVCQEGHMIHQLLHVLGLPHEHQRPDRDNNVRIIWKNVKPGVEKAIQKHNRLNGIDLLLPYGFNSITHLPPDCCSQDGKEIFYTNRTGGILLMGQRYLLEMYDIIKINRLYRCNESYYLGTDRFNLPGNWHESQQYKYEPVKGMKLVSETEIPGLPNGGGVFPRARCICGHEAFNN